MNCDLSNDMCCCKNVLDLDKLCADCARICWLKARKIWVDEEVANEICAQKVAAKEVFAEVLGTNSLCARSASINNLCVDNLQVKNQMLCNKYRATAVLTKDTLYSLNGDIVWDVVLDDPNGNMSGASYTVPKTGYYSVSFYVRMNSLAGSALITGIPVAVTEVKVNGLVFRSNLNPFLSFNTSQISTFSSLVLLNAGDLVTCDYKVQVIDPVSGLMDYVGTVMLAGNGTFPNECSFGIIMHSELCQDQPVTCVECPIVEIPCAPVHPLDCDPCDIPVGMAGAQAPVGDSSVTSPAPAVARPPRVR